MHTLFLDREKRVVLEPPYNPGQAQRSVYHCLGRENLKTAARSDVIADWPRTGKFKSVLSSWCLSDFV